MPRPLSPALLAAAAISVVLFLPGCGKDPKPESTGARGGAMDGAGGRSSDGLDPLPDYSLPSQPKIQYPPPPPLPLRSDDPAVGSIDDFIAKSAIDRNAAGWKTSLPKPPMVKFTPGKLYIWNIETSKGPIRIMLLPDVAPMHVSNAIYLTRLGFYDGLTFHRVMKGFMAQGGDPLGADPVKIGSGMPGYGLALEKDPTYRHDKRGVVSAAHSAMPNSDGSQFFLMFGPYPSLDGRIPKDQYTIYGQVTDGEAALKGLEAQANPRAPNGVPPLERLVIERATITVQ